MIDSIQTLHSTEMSGAPGSVGQVRESAAALAEVAKRQGTALILVGHVTKDGSLAGPRVLEHLVDCVLRFEGERERTYSTLRALKNRFGATAEVGVFEMRAGGLTEVADPSARFVEEATREPGSVVLPAMEGSRPVLVEVQALVAPSELESAAPGRQRDRPQPPQPGAGGALAPRAGSRSAAPTSSSTSPAGCGSTSRAPTSRSRWRSPRRTAGTSHWSPATASRWPASASSASPASCATSATPTAASPRRGKFGLGPVIGPTGGEPSTGAEPQTSLRGATASSPLSRSASRAPS